MLLVLPPAVTLNESVSANVLAVSLAPENPAIAAKSNPLPLRPISSAAAEFKVTPMV